MFRAATVGADSAWSSSLWWLIAWSVVLVMGAALMHRRYDRVFVDLL